MGRGSPEASGVRRRGVAGTVSNAVVVAARREGGVGGRARGGEPPGQQEQAGAPRSRGGRDARAAVLDPGSKGGRRVSLPPPEGLERRPRVRLRPEGPEAEARGGPPVVPGEVRPRQPV